MTTQRVGNIGTVTLEGMDDVLAALNRFGAYGKRNARKAIAATANQVRNDAIASINAHQSSGREYVKPTGSRNWFPREWMPEAKGKTHTASTKGNPPNTRDGGLVRSIRAAFENGGMTARVGSPLEYAYWLEFGTRNMGERPWLLPAMQQNTQFFLRALNAALDDAIKNAGLQ